MTVTPEQIARLRAPLPIESVEFRVQSISPRGWATILAYKDARVDMDRLDEVVGPGNWQRVHEEVQGHNSCKVGLWFGPDRGWVWKQDVGSPSNTEAVKGEASDAFKRACFNWGIGRELYEYPLILVELNPDEFEVTEYQGKKRVQATYALKLKEWDWKMGFVQEEGSTAEIRTLIAHDHNGAERFRFPRTASKARPPQPAAAGGTAESAPAPSQTPTDDKPWYNDFDKHRESLRKRLEAGERADDMLKGMRAVFKVSKKTETELRDLATSVTADRLGNDDPRGLDDVPF